MNKLNSRKTLKIAIIVAVLGVASIASAAYWGPEDAKRQQMIDFAKYFPNLVSKYYPDAPAKPTGLVLGSLTGPDIPYSYFSVNRVRHEYFRSDFSWVSGTNGTTTVCAFPMPLATSTLLFASINVTDGTSTAATMTLATSTSAFATTTQLDALVGVSSQWSHAFQGTTTRTSSIGGATKTISGTTATSTWLVWGLSGQVTGQTSPAGGFDIGGTCQAEVVVL